MRVNILVIIIGICILLNFSCKMRKNYSITQSNQGFSIFKDIKDPFKIIIELDSGWYTKIAISDDNNYLIASGYSLTQSQDLGIWNMNTFKKDTDVVFWNGIDLKDIKDIKIKKTSRLAEYYIAIASRLGVDVWKYKEAYNGRPSSSEYLGNFNISCVSISFLQDSNILACAHEKEIWRLNINEDSHLSTETFLKELVYVSDSDNILQVEYSGIQHSILALSTNHLMLIPFSPKNLQRVSSDNPQKIEWNNYKEWQEGKHFIKKQRCRLQSFEKMFIGEDGLIHIIGYPKTQIETWSLDIPVVKEHTSKWLWVWSKKEQYPQGGLSCANTRSLNLNLINIDNINYLGNPINITSKKLSNIADYTNYEFELPYFTKIKSTYASSAVTIKDYVKCKQPQLFFASYGQKYVDMIIGYPTCDYFFSIKKFFVGASPIVDFKAIYSKDMVVFSTFDGAIKIFLYKKALLPQLLTTIADLQDIKYIDLISPHELLLVKTDGNIELLNLKDNLKSLIKNVASNIKRASLSKDKQYLVVLWDDIIGVLNIRSNELKYYSDTEVSSSHSRISYEIAKLSSDNNYLITSDSFQTIRVLDIKSQKTVFNSSYVKNRFKTSILDLDTIIDDKFVVLDSSYNLILFCQSCLQNPYVYLSNRIQPTYKKDRAGLDQYPQLFQNKKFQAKLKVVVNNTLGLIYVFTPNKDAYSIIVDKINLKNFAQNQTSYIKLNNSDFVKHMLAQGELLLEDNLIPFDVDQYYVVSIIRDNKLIRWRLVDQKLDDLSSLYIVSKMKNNSENPYVFLKGVYDNNNFGTIGINQKGQVFLYTIGN